jgi:6-phosphogluconolactonase (cycloisomerase 2 family)
MKVGNWAKVILAGIPLLTGCGNFWKPPSTTTGTTGSSLSSGVFYVLNVETDQVAAYSIVSGTLTAVTGSPYTLASAPLSIAVAPSGNFVYVGTASGIYLYTVGAGGALTLGNNNAVISSDLATSMQVDSTGTWLVEAGPNLADVLAIPLSTTTGAPSSSTEQRVGIPAATVQQLVISPDNTHIFLALGTSGTEEVIFAAANSDPFGNEANIAVKNTGGAAVSVAVDPSNRLIYAGETVATTGSNAGGLRVFNYSTLDELSGSPYSTGGLAPYSILAATGGTYVYVANRTVSGSTTGNIAAFTVASTGTTTVTYSLTALGSAVSAGVTPLGMTEDSEGNYILVVNSGGDPDLEAYTMSSGALTSVLSDSTGADPVSASAIAALP